MDIVLGSQRYQDGVETEKQPSFEKQMVEYFAKVRQNVLSVITEKDAWCAIDFGADKDGSMFRIHTGFGNINLGQKRFLENSWIKTSSESFECDFFGNNLQQMASATKKHYKNWKLQYDSALIHD